MKSIRLEVLLSGFVLMAAIGYLAQVITFNEDATFKDGGGEGLSIFSALDS